MPMHEPTMPGRTMAGGWVDRKAADGKCRWCNLDVPAGRYTFCSDWCVNEWKLRTDPGYLREKVLLRDRGICAQCGMDTVAAWIDLKRSRGTHRLKLLARWGLKRLTRKSLWDADHVIPVAEGGGECDLENMRTLCLICHRRATVELRQRRRLEFNS